MSDTSRVDSQIESEGNYDNAVSVRFARQLEFELDKSQADLKSMLVRVANLIEAGDSLQEELRKLVPSPDFDFNDNFVGARNALNNWKDIRP
jgi:archaellum biogenesis protein FlaJ (TadC family)